MAREKISTKLLENQLKLVCDVSGLPIATDTKPGFGLDNGNSRWSVVWYHTNLYGGDSRVAYRNFSKRELSDVLAFAYDFLTFKQIAPRPIDMGVRENPPYSVEVRKPNKGGHETTYLVKRGYGPFQNVVGYVSKIRDTRTDTHPFKAWHVGHDEKIVESSFRVFYKDSRYAKDGAYPGGEKAAFEYAAGGKGYDVFDAQTRARKGRRNPSSRARKNPPNYTAAVRAHKGDLVIAQTGRLAIAYQPAYQDRSSTTQGIDLRYIPGIVTHVNRLGWVQAMKKKNGSPVKNDGDVTWLVVPAKHLNGYKPEAVVRSLDDEYDSLEEVRAAVRETVK
jgi:hypothetical protein